MAESALSGDLFVGLSGLTLGDKVVEFPLGIRLESTYAHIMSPITVAFAPAQPGKPHPAPWKSARGGFSQDVTAQITVPASAGESDGERLFIAQTLVFLIRLFSDPAIVMPALSNMPFARIASAADAEAHIMTVEHRRRAFMLSLVDKTQTIASLDWVAENFLSAVKLSRESREFRLAAHAIDSGQFIEDTALILISLWGALEAIFSPSTSELRFRVSALIAAYLNPPGEKRLEDQRRIAELYDKRSAAAHGKRKHDGEDVLLTFELLRQVLLQIIRDGEVPSKASLEAKLFGATAS